MKKLLIFPLLLFARIASADISWSQPNVATATIAQGYTYKLYITAPGQSSVTNAITLTGVACSAPAGTTTASCNAPSQQAINVGATVTGAKNELTATDPATGVESPKSVPFISPAVAPIQLVIR